MAGKYDYDSDDFYSQLEGYAQRGFTDGEVADAMLINYSTFSHMKNGTYKPWTDEENTRRSERIKDTLIKARRKTNALLRATYLQMALGTKKVTSTTKRWVEDRCECGGADRSCPYCGGTGRVVSTERAIIQETEAQLAPNMQAITTWLYQHDPEWTKTTKEGAVEETETAKGFNIERWIEGMSMAEQQDSIEANETEDKKEGE